MNGDGVIFLKVIICTSGFLYCSCGRHQNTKSLREKENTERHVKIRKQVIASICVSHGTSPRSCVFFAVCVVIDGEYLYLIFQDQFASH